jgi:hypothetical protein
MLLEKVRKAWQKAVDGAQKQTADPQEWRDTRMLQTPTRFVFEQHRDPAHMVNMDSDHVTVIRNPDWEGHKRRSQELFGYEPKWVAVDPGVRDMFTAVNVANGDVFFLGHNTAAEWDRRGPPKKIRQRQQEKDYLTNLYLQKTQPPKTAKRKAATHLSHPTHKKPKHSHSCTAAECQEDMDTTSDSKLSSSAQPLQQSAGLSTSTNNLLCQFCMEAARKMLQVDANCQLCRVERDLVHQRRKHKRNQQGLHRFFARFLTAFEYIAIPQLDTKALSKNQPSRKIGKRTVRQMMSLAHRGFLKKLEETCFARGSEILWVTEEYSSKLCFKCHACKHCKKN